MASITQLASSGIPPLPSKKREPWIRRYLPTIIVFALSIGVAIALLAVNNPAEPGSSGYWVIVQSRLASVGTIVLVAVAQSVATLMFHTATSNRILTPSILGFDALYVLSQTALVFVFGVSAGSMEGIPKILAQSALMVLFATALYTWLFSGKRQNLHLMLLVGVV